MVMMLWKNFNLYKWQKAVGFTLAEIKEVIEAWYQKEMSCEAQLKVLDLKLIQIDKKMKELKEMKK
jgi:MerR family copper efflux transcriptional regulator